MRAARPVRRRATPAWFVVAVCVCLAAPAAAQPVRVTPTIGARITWTNNYDLASDSERESDFITTITPGLSVNYTGPRGFLRGHVRVPLLIYAEHSSENRARPSVALNGNLEVVPDFFFIDAHAVVTQTFFSPFGTRSSDIENVSENSYTSQSYSIAPYIQGRIGGNTTYQLRDENIWTVASNASGVARARLRDSYINRLSGTINRDPTPLGWGVDINRTEYWFSGRDSRLRQQARLRGVWQPRPQLQLFVTAGYEQNKFEFSDINHSIYGAGLHWRPTLRTSLTVNVEERFFGTGYNVTFDHRSPRTVWRARATRDTTSYPELIAQLPPGLSVEGLLGDLLASRIPDAAERAQFVSEFIEERGLPPVLSGPLDLFDQEIVLRESAIASLGLLGTQNTVFFNVFTATTEDVGAEGALLPPELGGRENKQTGASVAWSYRLGPLTSMTLSTRYTRSESEPESTFRANYMNVRFNVTRTVSPKTTVFAGARWQKRDSRVDSNDYTEAAMFAGFNHSFR